MFLLFGSGCSDNQQKPADLGSQRINGIVQEISADSISATFHQLVEHNHRNVADTISGANSKGSAGQWIQTKFEQYREASNNRLKIHNKQAVEGQGHALNSTTGYSDIVAILPGTQLESKDRMYVVGAQFSQRRSDSSNGGINKKNIGIATVLELARVMSLHEFDATIVFLAVSANKKRSPGTGDFLGRASEKKLNVTGMFSINLFSGSPMDIPLKRDRVQVFSAAAPPDNNLSQYNRRHLNPGEENDSPSHQLGRFFHRVSEDYLNDLEVELINRKDWPLQDENHPSFLLHGFPAIQLREAYGYADSQHNKGLNENQQGTGLTLPSVDFHYAEKLTKLNAAALATLASAPARPQNVQHATQAQENEIRLQWKDNKEPDIKGYEVLWRKRNQPYWESAKLIVDSTHFTLQNSSITNFIFGVRSVDQYGNRSPAAYAVPKNDQELD